MLSVLMSEGVLYPMIGYLKMLEDQICGWPGVSAEPHRFGGSVFRLGRWEIGHLHNDGAVEVPLPRALREHLVSEGLAGRHRTYPNSAWITFHISKADDVRHAAWLLRLSYLRYVLKAVPEPAKRFEQESERLRLTPQVRDLLARFVPGAERVAAA